ncbi:MAG TPA: hypothetical protein VGM90_00120 [Kofleriaceae bacterium]|jgi:hypothetical protein
MNKGFSFASVVLSYFLVAGGLLLGMLIQTKAHFESQYLLDILLGVGAFIGGFIAARASTGSTILEPAIGAVAVIASIIGSIALTSFGKMIWHIDPDGVGKGIALMGGASLAGALGGAFLSEKLFGESTQSGFPWVFYSAVAALGASFLAFVFGTIAMVNSEMPNSKETGMQILVGIAIGCFVSSIAVGASARVRTLFASFLGNMFGVGGLFAIIGVSQGGADRDAIIGLVMFSVMGGIVGLIGTAIGWAMFGKKNAA